MDPYSEVSTQPFTPESFSEDVMNGDREGVFAWLRPLNPAAREGYHAAVNSTIKEKFQHIRQFLSVEPKSNRATSVFTEDGGADNESLEMPQWTGEFRFCLETLPHDASKGWILGTGRGGNADRDLDILLASSGEKWAKLRIAARHAELFFHKESGRFVIKAHHHLTLSRDGMQHLERGAINVLEHGEVIGIGNCSYNFGFTDHFSSRAFEESLSTFMKAHCQPDWSLNRHLSPASTGKPVALGNYYCSQGGVDQGAFGKVAAGWSRKGAAVAIKHFWAPKRAAIDSHIELMRNIGAHDNLLQLLECIDHFATKVPSAHCVYTPLAVANLADVLDMFQFDSGAKLTLFTDYLRGLSFLHGQKGVMHRDIKPANLAVVSFLHPKGIIIDLDDATSEPTSNDHMKGTIVYLAPEILDLKDWEEKLKRQPHRNRPKPAPYDKQVDVWALGLSMYALYKSQAFHWGQFIPENHPQKWVKNTRMTAELLTAFHRSLQEPSQIPEAALFPMWIKEMTHLIPSARLTASELLLAVEHISKSIGEGSIVPKSGLKRPRE